MILNQSRVRNIEAHLGSVPEGTHIRILVDATPDRLKRAGHSADPQLGDSVLPPTVGSTTRFNSEGRFIVHRDQPKESRYITTIEWTWEQWSGPDQSETMTDFKEIYRDCYPRTFVEPPSAELTYHDAAGLPVLISPELIWKQDNREHVRHVINVFLELFRTCDVRTADLGALRPPAIRRVNWTLLPPGHYPWSRIDEHIRDLMGRRSPRYAGPVLYRHHAIAERKPAEVYVGVGGFREYVAFVFPDHGIAILESTRTDNATYVFGMNWQRLSQLTKAEVLAGGLNLDRFIHADDWAVKIDQLFRKTA